MLASRGQLAFDGEGVTQLPNDMGHWAMGLPGSPTLRGVDDADELTGERSWSRADGSIGKVTEHYLAFKARTISATELAVALRPSQAPCLANAKAWRAVLISVNGRHWGVCSTFHFPSDSCLA